MALIKNSFAAFCTFEQAASTAKLASFVGMNAQGICLCNGAMVPREQQHCLDMDNTNLLANNLVGRVLDELVVPLRRLQLSEQERVALTALIWLDGGGQI